MESAILNRVLELLREEGFCAGPAYPGQKYPHIDRTVVTVHTKQMDSANLAITMEVSVITPAAMGGTVCESTAMWAAELLENEGAHCVQNGCTYDGVSQVYVVNILATFVGTTSGMEAVIWPGFRCNINDEQQHFVVRLQLDEITGREVEFVTGEGVPTGVSEGCRYWAIEMEELIPVGESLTEDPEGSFTLKLTTKEKVEQYVDCTWLSSRLTYSREGIRRVHKGIALGKEEVDDDIIIL